MLLIGVLDLIFGQQSSRVWVDHVDLSSDLDHDKDYVSAMVPGTVFGSHFSQYDGLLDITHGSTFVTVSWSYLHDVCRFFHSNLILTHGPIALEGFPHRPLR